MNHYLQEQRTRRLIVRAALAEGWGHQPLAEIEEQACRRWALRLYPIGEDVTSVLVELARQGGIVGLRADRITWLLLTAHAILAADLAEARAA